MLHARLRTDGHLRMLEQHLGAHVGELADLVLRQELERIVDLDVEALHRLAHFLLRALHAVHLPLLLVVHVKVQPDRQVDARRVAVNDLSLDEAVADLVAVLVGCLALAVHARLDLVAAPRDLQRASEPHAHCAHNARLACAVGADDAIEPCAWVGNLGVAV